MVGERPDRPALVLLDRRRAAEARDLLAPVVPFSERTVGAEHVRTNDARLALGRVLLAMREYARAEPLLRTAAAAFEQQRKAQPSSRRRARRRWRSCGAAAAQADAGPSPSG